MSDTVAGVDWAGDGWIASIFSDGEFRTCQPLPEFQNLWDLEPQLNPILVDVPIGLPSNRETLKLREELDSCARSITGKSSSVFPVPSREAAETAYRDKAEYEMVAKANEDELEKGLNKQTYSIAHSIGEVDSFLLDNEDARTKVIESHPELCFWGLREEQLKHSKKSAAGVGERLTALGTIVDNPGDLLEEATTDLIGETVDAAIDDVLDALVLGVVANQGESELSYIPEDWETDSRDIPIRMAFWTEKQASCVES